MLNAVEVECPALSFTPMLTVNDPARVGVPEMVPLEDRLRPLGSWPLTYGPGIRRSPAGSLQRRAVADLCLTARQGRGGDLQVRIIDVDGDGRTGGGLPTRIAGRRSERVNAI